MLKYGTKVKVVSGAYAGIEGSIAHPLVVELICNRTGKPFIFKDTNCVIPKDNVNEYFWLADDQLLTIEEDE